MADMTVRRAHPVRKPQTRYHHGDLRRALIDEAVRTIGRSGAAGLTLRSAGERLGVSRTALYRHFSDKGALLAAVASEGFQRFTRDLQRAWEEGGPNLDGFNRMGRAYVGFALENPSHYRVMFGEFRELCTKDPELQQVAYRSFEVLLNAIVTLQRAGVMRVDDPVMTGNYIWATMHGIAALAINGLFGTTREAVDPIVRHAIERLNDALRPRSDVPAHPLTNSPVPQLTSSIG